MYVDDRALNDGLSWQREQPSLAMSALDLVT